MLVSLIAGTVLSLALLLVFSRRASGGWKRGFGKANAGT